jgi:uncharacterized RDD family membrane protein YckC
MEDRITNTKGKRFLAFIFDLAFIMLLEFTIYMLLGLIFKIDSEVYQNFMIFPLLLILISYLFFWELFFKNTLGKYLLGIELVNNENHEKPSLQSYIKRGLLKIIFPVEGIVLLLSKNNKRLGDLWAKTIVVNIEINKLKPSARAIIGIAALIVLVFCFRISMGLAVKNADFYNIGINNINSNTSIKIIGLPKFVNQTRHTVNFFVPISNENQDKYAIIYLEKNGTDWSVNHTDFTKEHIIGFSYSFSYSSSKE